MAVTNEIPAKKKTKISGEKLSGVLPNSFWRPKKRVSVPYDKFDIFFSRFITTRH